MMKTDFNVKISAFILLAYLAITLIVTLCKDQKGLIQTTCYFIFMVQQIHLLIRYELHETGEIWSASVIQVLSFVCILCPFIPFRYFIGPVSFIFSFVFWVAYAKAIKCDLTGAIFKYLYSIMLIVFVAFVSHYLIVRAYM